MFSLLIISSLVWFTIAQMSKHMDSCSKEEGCAGALELYLCRVATDYIHRQENSPLTSLDEMYNIKVKGERGFLGGHLISIDLYDVFELKLSNCEFTIDYLQNQCPLLYQFEKQKTKIEKYNFSCFQLLDNELVKFKDCLNDYDRIFNQRILPNKGERKTELCLKGQGQQSKVFKAYEKFSKYCIIDKKCTEIQEEIEDGLLQAQIDSSQSFCSSNCEICSNFYQCDTCKEGYKLGQHKICQKQECQEPKFFFKGECRENCPENYRKEGNSCQLCKNEFCKDCSERTEMCKQCKDNYVLFGNDCLDQCQTKYFNDGGECKSCSEHCLQCSKSQCDQCKEGYRVEDGKCILDCNIGQYEKEGYCVDCNQDCKVCKGNGTKQCKVCQDGYFLQEDEGVCKQYCFHQQYQDLNNKKCSNCHQNCNGCKGPTEKDCIFCEKNENICEVVKKESDNLTKHCITSLHFKNCKFCTDDTFCSECNDPYKLDKGYGQCFAENEIMNCEVGCKTCITDKENKKICLNCNDNYNLNENKQCQSNHNILIPIAQTFFGIGALGTGAVAMKKRQIIIDYASYNYSRFVNFISSLNGGYQLLNNNNNHNNNNIDDDDDIL